MDLSQQTLQTNDKFFFSNFIAIQVFEILTKDRIIFKRIERPEY